MKDFVKKYFSTRQKKNWQESLKNGEKNGFHKPENPFPPAGMKDFVEKYSSTRQKINWQESLKNGAKNGFR